MDSHFNAFYLAKTRKYRITVKGLQKEQLTHCQVNVYPNRYSKWNRLLPSAKEISAIAHYSLPPIVQFKSSSAKLISNPVPIRETTSCHNDTTAVTIAADFSQRTYIHMYVYTCTVAFSDNTQYRQADFSLTRVKHWYCTEQQLRRDSRWREIERLSVEHAGANVYRAKFAAPAFSSCYSRHVCNVRLNDGRSYTSGER